ncbi:NitT/TauT family transport system substrate-binding protein [Candidatus Hakubella thermalkaliphila]|nr:NitT/TauT family transport system substrate-binding protein [Candidatus Hakubella thermalkaliphila]
MRKSTINILLILGALLSGLMIGCGRADSNNVTVRIGYFPNITHSQAVIGVANDAFQEALGPDVTVEVKVFNAGPSVIEALFAGGIDLAYIGPNPAINGYVRSQGKALRIVAGASSGGAVFVVRPDANINTVEDLNGKKIASPQLGNTQDIALRAFLKAAGLSPSEKGGTVQALPVANPDILTLFLKGDIDGAWVPEPWGARLIKEAGGKLFLDERSIWPEGKFNTAHVIVRTEFLEEHPELVKKWLEVHVDLTRWINNHPEEAKKMLNAEIKRLAGKALREDVLDDAFSRIEVTYDPIKSSLFTSALWAYEAGFLGKEKPDLSGIYDLSLLNQILEERNLEPIR